MLDKDLRLPVELLPGESDDYLYELTLDAMTRPEEPAEHFIPRDLDEFTPGPFLGAILSRVDVSRLKGKDVVTVLRAQQRQTSHHHGGVYAAMAEVAYCISADSFERSVVIDEYAVEESGAALSYTRRKAERELGIALGLRIRLPDVQRALELGTIDASKAALLCTETDHLGTAEAAQVVGRLIDIAPELTTGQLRSRISRLCLETEPDSAKKRMKHSLEQRKVVAEPNAQGTAALVISECAPDEVLAARDHINVLAKRLKTADEQRTIDQLRADVALGLLSGRIEDDGRRGGSVTIHVDMTTLAELDEAPGELSGYGPVIAEITRKVAREQTDGRWSTVVTDPETGEPLHVVSVRRRPSARQTRKIRALHPTCVFRGCRMPAEACDIDHIVDYAKGGGTLVCNHAPLCRRHHMAKHERGWRYCKVGRTDFEWVSPLGHRYRTGRPP
jgi:hypothetical protein